MKRQAGPGEGPEQHAGRTRRGYALAAANMVVSGAAIYVNSLGVAMFADSTLYTALKNLFVPCRSTKGGMGLGLAISKHLADHLGAKLELKRTGPRGCVMELTLPVALFPARPATDGTVSAVA